MYNVRVPFLVLVSILHSADFTFKPFKFASNILVKGRHWNFKMSQMSLIFISNDKKMFLSHQTGFLSGQNLSLASDK